MIVAAVATPQPTIFGRIDDILSFFKEKMEQNRKKNTDVITSSQEQSVRDGIGVNIKLPFCQSAWKCQVKRVAIFW